MAKLMANFENTAKKKIIIKAKNSAIFLISLINFFQAKITYVLTLKKILDLNIKLVR